MTSYKHACAGIHVTGSSAAEVKRCICQTGWKMSLGSTVYRALFRRTSTFALTIVVGAVVFERAFDQGADALYEHINRGKLWNHIKHKYEQSDE
ncbi:hypothetical protein GDO86_001728 [Hymenochirus boettgeri]|uniref:Cytochrome b-c1 complex subunit 9 n=1 Tax=Hymenochirus boettgeri TaxID=247094 RepID=A0A8T2KI96_9PIPI|nr:hypothetical protein GDO86_001728 [Hymenochirus boettgeri]